MKKSYKKKSSKPAKKAVDVIINGILESLEKGVIPWDKPWAGGGRAKNLVSKKSYRGLNQLILNMQGFSSPWWLTFKQAAKLGGNVKKGSKGTAISLWKFFDKEVEIPESERTEEQKEKGISTKKESSAMVKYFTVFNIEQCEGIEAPKEDEIKPREITSNETAEKIIANYLEKSNGLTLDHGGDEAYYMPIKDHVQMPTREQFKCDDRYYTTTFHELVHSTGHKKRLSRKEVNGEKLTIFGSEDYSREELVAEIGAWILAAECGFENTIRDNAVAYCKGWLKKLKNDKKMLLVAGARAEKAAAYILGEKDSTQDVSEDQIKE